MKVRNKAHQQLSTFEYIYAINNNSNSKQIFQPKWCLYTYVFVGSKDMRHNTHIQTHVIFEISFALANNYGYILNF